MKEYYYESSCFCLIRFWRKFILGNRRRHDETQSTKDFCWHTMLDGTGGDGTSESVSQLSLYRTMEVTAVDCAFRW